MRRVLVNVKQEIQVYEEPGAHQVSRPYNIREIPGHTRRTRPNTRYYLYSPIHYHCVEPRGYRMTQTGPLS